MNYQINPENLHLIGHSLGAHMSGYIAKEMKLEKNLTVNRITGLDPAGPGFDFPDLWYEKYGNITETHLWYTDASFVDVIHTGKSV